MPEPISSADLRPGTKLRHKNGHVVTLDRRKRPGEERHGLPYHPGWWLRDDAGGLADFVIDADESDWTILAAVSVSENPEGAQSENANPPAGVSEHTEP